MNKTVKISLIVGSILICIGLIVVLAVGFTSGWNFATAWEYRVYETGEDIFEIDLEFSAGALKVEFYDGDTIKVEYHESREFTTKFTLSGRTLRIATTQVRWYSSFMWFNKIPETKMYIPQNMQLGLKMQVNAGSVNFGAGTFDDVDIKINAGAISMSDVNCSSFKVDMNAGAVNVSQIVSSSFRADVSAGSLHVKSLKCDDIGLDLSAGSAKLNIVGKKSDYTIRTDVSAGSCNVSSQSGGSKRLTVDVSAGSVTINFDE